MPGKLIRFSFFSFQLLLYLYCFKNTPRRDLFRDRIITIYLLKCIVLFSGSIDERSPTCSLCKKRLYRMTCFFPSAHIYIRTQRISSLRVCIVNRKQHSFDCDTYVLNSANNLYTRREWITLLNDQYLLQLLVLRPSY